jgi:hypothetical protein
LAEAILRRNSTAFLIERAKFRDDIHSTKHANWLTTREKAPYALSGKHRKVSLYVYLIAVSNWQGRFKNKWKGKDSVVPVRAVKPYRNGGAASLMLNLGTRRKWLILRSGCFNPGTHLLGG